MKNLSLFLALAVATAAFTSDAQARPGRPGNGPGRPGNGPGFGNPGRPGNGPGFGNPGRPGNGPGFGNPGRPGNGPGFGNPGRPGNGPGFGNPGRPGNGPGFGNPGRPGNGPGFGNPGRPGNGPGFGNPGRPGFGPGFGNPGRPGFGGRPGWRPGPRPGFRPGWGHNRGWHRPVRWRAPRRIGWLPPIFIPIPMPSEGYDSLCQGNFVGVFGSDRDAYMSLDSAGISIRGNLVLMEPDANYRVDGTCSENGDSADVSISLNGGHAYEGQIFVAEDGEVYFEGSQSGSNISFELKRQ